jgi:isoquinoline 1-oxidoreductase beta subunit
MSNTVDTTDTTTTRRDFIRAGAIAGGGLLLGVYLPAQPALARALTFVTGAEPFAPNAWIRIDGNGLVTVMLNKSEMGQGVATSLPVIVAEELDADWSQVRFENAPADPAYIDPAFGTQITGGSTSVANSWKGLRTAGAAAREMLVTAAANRWGVDASTCSAANSYVTHAATGRRLSYGELASSASAVPVPKEPRLKDPKDFRLIGTRIPRLDIPSKVNGSAVFGIDVKVPGAFVAVVARPPVFGATLATFDDKKARATSGVHDVVAIASGIAVVGDGYWPATQGRRALSITWNEGENAKRSSATISRQLRAAAKEPGIVATNTGDATAALAGAAKRVEAEYEVPFLAHAAMEPLNCTASVTRDRCEVWAPTQWQDKARAVAANASGLPESAVTIHTTYVGGGFGRKLDVDAIGEAVEVSKKIGAPVKIIHSREDDIQHDFYRTAGYAKMTAGLDASGALTVWKGTVASGSSMRRMFPAFIGKDNLDFDACSGIRAIPYAVPNVQVNFVEQELGVPVGAWRSVGDSWNAFIRECFIDEIAAAAHKDPVDFRRSMITDKRMLGVLNLAAEKAGWGAPLPRSHARGVALNQFAFSNTSVAEVAEVSVINGVLQVHRIVAAVDCGTVVNPDTVMAQIEGGIIFGLTAALKGEITIEGGRVKQSNFRDYPVLRMSELPKIEVYIVPSTEAPTGVGEPGTPPVAPAVANAVRAVTGKPVRSLPIRLAAVTQAGVPRKASP